MKISNAEIKLCTDLGGVLMLDEKDILFNGCNISGGIIQSYHHPQFQQCFFKNVVQDGESPGNDDGPIFFACRIEDTKIPTHSGFSGCTGDVPTSAG